jgi:hypothetical protein
VRATTTQPQAGPPPLKAVNDVPLTRKLLEKVLADLSKRLYRSFQQQVRLVVHGGAVMVLHKGFNHRESTQDIDYLHGSFVKEYRALGFTDAEQRLHSCIADTARKFGLGADWMNDHADVALPLALEYAKWLFSRSLSDSVFPVPQCVYGARLRVFFVVLTYGCSKQGRTYDPVFYDSLRQHNVGPQTIFDSQGLALVAVPWPWAMALKLIRYEKQDPADCAAVLRLGVAQHGIRWTCEGIEQWITEFCWPMRYDDYTAQKRQQLRERIQDALDRAFPPESLGKGVTPPMPSRAPSAEVGLIHL